MTTAKISSEKDSDVQVGAQAFAATSVEQRHSVLLAVSAGQTSITDAAHELGLGDAGQVLALMRQAQIPITIKPLPAGFVKNQTDSTLDAMRSSMLSVSPKSS